MTLRTRLFLFVTVSFTAAAALLSTYTRYSVLGSFAALEVAAARERALATASLLQQLAGEFRAASEDWAIWTEAVDFACAGGEAFVTSNMGTELFVTKKWHHLALVRSPDHGVAYAGTFEGHLSRNPSGDLATLLATLDPTKKA